MKQILDMGRRDLNWTKTARLEAEGSLIIIPALEPAPQLVDYVRSLLQEGFRQIIIVNDGSSPKSEGIFSALAQLPGCVVLRHGVNRGKGAALKTALQYCLDQNWKNVYRTAIMVDADGQHAVPDVCRMAAASAEQPDAYILGVRDFSEEIVPTRSRFGNRLTSGAFRLLYGRYLQDTQTGLRAVPSSLWEWAVSIHGERFEYETNCLIQAVKHGVPLAEVKIETLYFDQNAGTHYHTLRDSWPIFLILIQNVGAYFFSSVFFALVDIAIFYYLEHVLLTGMNHALRLLTATVAGTAVAAALNRMLRRILSVPEPQTAPNDAPRYWQQLLTQTSASYLLILALFNLIRWPAVVIKVLVDLGMDLVGYLAEVRGARKVRYGIG